MGEEQLRAAAAAGNPEAQLMVNRLDAQRAAATHAPREGQSLFDRARSGEDVAADIPPPATTEVPRHAPASPQNAPVSSGSMPFAQTTQGTFQGASLSKADAAAGIASKREATAHRQGILAETTALRAKWAADADQYARTLGKKGDAAHKRFQELDAELGRIKGEVGSQDIKMLAGFDKTSKALLIMAAAMEGWAAAGLRRPSNTVGLLRGAIEGDLQRQRVNLRKRLMLMQTTEDQRDKALARYDVLEGQRRRQIAQVAQLKLAQLGTQQKGVDAKLDLANSILELKRLSRPTVRTVTTRQPIATGGAALDKTQARDFKKNLSQFQAGRREVGQLKQLLSQARGSVLRGAVVPTGLGIRIRKSLDTLALINRKVMGDSGPIRGDDIKTFDKIGASGFLAQALGDKGDLIERLNAFDADIDAATRREAQLLLADPAALARGAITADQRSTKQVRFREST